MELLDFLQPFEDECVYPFSSWQLVKKKKGETTTLDYLSTCINLRGNLSTAHTHTELNSSVVPGLWIPTYKSLFALFSIWQWPFTAAFEVLPFWSKSFSSVMNWCWWVSIDCLPFLSGERFSFSLTGELQQESLSEFSSLAAPLRRGFRFIICRKINNYTTEFPNRKYFSCNLAFNNSSNN